MRRTTAAAGLTPTVTDRHRADRARAGAIAERAIRSSLTLPVTDSVCGVRGTTRWWARCRCCPAGARNRHQASSRPSASPSASSPPAAGLPCTGSGSAPAGIVGGVGVGPVDGSTDGVGDVRTTGRRRGRTARPAAQSGHHPATRIGPPGSGLALPVQSPPTAAAPPPARPESRPAPTLLAPWSASTSLRQQAPPTAPSTAGSNVDIIPASWPALCGVDPCRVGSRAHRSPRQGPRRRDRVDTSGPAPGSSIGSGFSSLRGAVVAS